MIGAGAAGLLATYSAAESGKNVILIEKNDYPGKKLLMTGKGRCNITNDSSIDNLINNVTKNGNFLYSSFSEFSSKEIIQFFNDAGLKTKTERGNRVFPASDKAEDVVKTLYDLVKKKNVNIIINKRVDELIIEDSKIKGVKTQTGETFTSSAVIVCTGGYSYPGTGSNGDGHRMTAKIGHIITEIKPGLVPIELRESWVQELMGLSLKNIELSAYIDNDQIFRETGEMIFTHFGISGPLVLSLSSYLPDIEKHKDKINIYIDLKPALNYEKLDKRILRDFSENLNK